MRGRVKEEDRGGRRKFGAQTSQLANKDCHEMWVWSVASLPRGWVYPTRVQYGILFYLKIINFYVPPHCGTTFICEKWCDSGFLGLHSSLLLEVWEQSLHTSLLEAKEVT